MKNARSLDTLETLLVREGGYTDEIGETRVFKRRQDIRHTLLAHIREVGRGADLPLIIATEKAIVANDLKLYANSRQMTSSLQTALNEIEVIERHIGIVGDPEQYRVVDQAHSLPRNRRGGLPFDEARQALAGHAARLNNMDKSRLDDDEKKIIDARRAAVSSAIKLYTAHQAQALGIGSGPAPMGAMNA